jgi:hypothetical protein
MEAAETDQYHAFRTHLSRVCLWMPPRVTRAGI